MVELNKEILLIYYWTFGFQQTLNLKRKKANVGDIVHGTSLALPYDKQPHVSFDFIFLLNIFLYVKGSILNLHSKKNSHCLLVCAIFSEVTYLWLQRR